MAKCDPDWETLRTFRYAAPYRYRAMCMDHLSLMLDSSMDELQLFLDKITIFDENKNAHGNILVTHQMVVEVEYLIQQLKKNNNLKIPLLFRKPGSKARCNQLRLFLAERRFVEIELGNFTPCDVASVLKKILQDPKEPLLTSVLYLAYCQVQGLVKPGMLAKQVTQALGKQRTAIRILFLLLPEDNYMLMRELLFMLHAIHDLQEFNQMDAHSLAVCLAPSLVCPREFTMKEFQRNTTAAVSTLKFMIENAPDLFVIPPQLLTDTKKHMQLLKIGLNAAYGESRTFSGSNCSPPVSTLPRFMLADLKRPKIVQNASIQKKHRKFLNSFRKGSIDETIASGINSVHNTAFLDLDEALAIYKEETLLQKSTSFAKEGTHTSSENLGKRKGFFQKFFPEKESKKNELSKKQKSWSWLSRGKGKDCDVTIPSGDHTGSNETLWDYKHNPSCSGMEKQVNRTMSNNVIPSHLKVQNVGKVDSRFSVLTGQTVQLSPCQSFTSSTSTIIRKRTFVVRKHSYGKRNVKDTIPVQEKKRRRRSTFLLKDHDWFDSLPTIFNSDSDLDEVFSDEVYLSDDEVLI